MWILKRGNFDWRDTGSPEKEQHPLLEEITCKQSSSKNTDRTGTSGTSPFLWFPQALGTASGHLAQYLQAKNIPYKPDLSLQMLQESDSWFCQFSMGNLLGKVLLMAKDATQCSSPGMTGRDSMWAERAAHSWVTNASSLTSHSSWWSMEVENEGEEMLLGLFRSANAELINAHEIT